MGCKERYELWAEAIRDIGILFLVFAPLDTLLKSEPGHWYDWPLAVGIAIVGWVLLYVGVGMGTDP